MPQTLLLKDFGMLDYLEACLGQVAFPIRKAQECVADLRAELARTIRGPEAWPPNLLCFFFLMDLKDGCVAILYSVGELNSSVETATFCSFFSNLNSNRKRPLLGLFGCRHVNNSFQAGDKMPKGILITGSAGNKSIFGSLLAKEHSRHGLWPGFPLCQNIRVFNDKINGQRRYFSHAP